MKSKLPARLYLVAIIVAGIAGVATLITKNYMYALTLFPYAFVVVLGSIAAAINLRQ